MNLTDLGSEYLVIYSQADSLKTYVLRELEKLLSDNLISTGVPLEGRVKTWESAEKKIKDKSYSFDSIVELHDLIGVRVILLFLNDVVRTKKVIEQFFQVHESQDQAEKLEDSKFGYQSHHMTVSLLENWTAVPTMKGLEIFKIEVQVRTLAQHTWAAASHKLQYKHEADIPKQIRRTINRVSALLETVDLELERVQQERDEYKQETILQPQPAELLNVDLLENVLAHEFPPENKHDIEPYSNFLQELSEKGIKTLEALTKLLEKHKAEVLYIEKETVSSAVSDPRHKNDKRISRGVVFSHVALGRLALVLEFGAVGTLTRDKIKLPGYGLKEK